MIELATHLEEKAARLKPEGLGKIKVALAGYNTSSLLDTLEGAFGSIDQEEISTTSISEIKEATKEHTPLSPSIPSPEESGLIGAELVFPTQSICLVMAGIPETLLPLYRPEMQSHYRCQFWENRYVFLLRKML